MSDYGHFKIFRKLFQHPTFVAAPLSYKWVLITLLDAACYKPSKFDDHGMIIDLLPGQYMTTIRALTKLANVKPGVVERALACFSHVEILRQEVRHTKTIITISTEYILDSVTTGRATTSRQDRDTNKETKKASVDVYVKDIEIFPCLKNLPIHEDDAMKITEYFIDFEIDVINAVSHATRPGFEPDNLIGYIRRMAALKIGPYTQKEKKNEYRGKRNNVQREHIKPEGEFINGKRVV